MEGMLVNTWLWLETMQIMQIIAIKETAMAALLKLRLVPRIWNPLSMLKSEEDFGDAGLLYCLESELLNLSDVG